MQITEKQENIINKVSREAGIVLDEYLTARMQYTFICQTIDDQTVNDRYDNSRAAHIFNLIISTFMHDILKTLYNVVFDEDRSSASIHNLIKSLKNNMDFFEEYNKNCLSLPVHIVSNIPHHQANDLLDKFKQEQSLESHRRFVNNYKQLADEYKTMKSGPNYSTLKNIRHKVVSHIDIYSTPENIVRRSIAYYGLQWDQIDTIIDDVEKLVGLSLVCCASTSHFFQYSKDQYINITKEFWDISRSKGWLFRGGVHITDKKRRKIRHHLRSHIRKS